MPNQQLISTESPLLVQRHDHVAIWTINLPHQRNPITGLPVIEALVAEIEQANADLSLRCVILTGAGQAFSGGGNIKEIRAGAGHFGAPPFEATEGYRSGIQRLARAVFGCEVPIIAAVNGPAIGAGCDLTLMCDLRIASREAVFAESFVKLGLIPGDGGAWLLPRLVGHARAAQMTLTGEVVDAEQALAWGLVSSVVEREDLMSTALDLARRIAVNPPLATRMAKRLLRQAEHQRLDDALELAATMQAVAHHTKDHRAAIAVPPQPSTAQ
jgi:enoyl-CoA hydratase/carnithine racemase